MSEDKKKNHWSQDQDNKLIELVSQHGRNWANGNYVIDDKNSDKCRHRYTYLCKRQSEKKWTDDEDNILINFIFDLVKQKLDTNSFIPIVRLKRDIYKRVIHLQSILHQTDSQGENITKKVVEKKQNKKRNI